MYLSNSKRQIYISISIKEKMNSRLTLCMTLHIKGDKEFQNTNLETKGDQKFDVLNQYQTLEITDRTMMQKNCCNYRKMFDQIWLKNMYL